MQHILKPVRILMVEALAALAAATASAETAPSTAPPPAGSSTASPAQTTADFVAKVIPNANFVASASRMAIAHASNPKLRELAGDLAKDQTSLANSLTAWVNVSGPVVTRQSPYPGQTGGPAKVSAPRLLPAQADTLQRLSTAQGRAFDQLYVSSLMEALVQLQTVYHDFGKTGTDPGLQAIAARELPKVEKTIASLDAL